MGSLLSLSLYGVKTWRARSRSFAWGSRGHLRGRTGKPRSCTTPNASSGSGSTPSSSLYVVVHSTYTSAVSLSCSPPREHTSTYCFHTFHTSTHIAYSPNDWEQGRARERARRRCRGGTGRRNGPRSQPPLRSLHRWWADKHPAEEQGDP